MINSKPLGIKQNVEKQSDAEHTASQSAAGLIMSGCSSLLWLTHGQKEAEADKQQRYETMRTKQATNQSAEAAQPDSPD